MENYGFVYIWYDRKHKRFYIGSHWGTEDDGYICSSNWMRDAYRRRPDDFKRRIIEKSYNRKILLEIEHKWLSLIPSSELGKGYYNLRKHMYGHWTTDNEKMLTLPEKISKKTKEAMQRPDIKERHLVAMRSKTYTQSRETKEKRRNTMIQTMSKKFPTENRLQRLDWGSEELNQIYAEKSKELWNNRSSEEKASIGEKISKSLEKSKAERSAKVSELKWWNNGINNKRSKTCPGPEWFPGRH